MNELARTRRESATSRADEEGARAGRGREVVNERATLRSDHAVRASRALRGEEDRTRPIRSARGRNSSIHSLRGARRPPRSAPPGRLLRLRRGRVAAAFFAFRRLLPAASAPAAASAAATAAPAVRRASRRALNVRAVRAGDLDGFRAAVVALLDRVLDRLFLLARRWASGWGVGRVRDGTIDRSREGGRTDDGRRGAEILEQISKGRKRKRQRSIDFDASGIGPERATHLAQGAETLRVNRGLMHEYFLAAVVRGDEPEPFLGVEPLHLRARIGDDGDRCVESPAERGKIS